MRCPRCEEELEPGFVTMKMPFASLNFGLSSKDLVFNPAEGEPQKVVDGEAKRVEAAGCKGCGAVLILGDQPD